MPREWTGSVANLGASMRLLAEEFAKRGYSTEASNVRREREYLADQAYTLAEWADAIEQLYARLDEGEVPTNAQGVALARFLRGHFRNDRFANATVTRGGMGLSDKYLLVRMSDGYTGGIAPNGDTST